MINKFHISLFEKVWPKNEKIFIKSIENVKAIIYIYKNKEDA